MIYLLCMMLGAAVGLTVGALCNAAHNSDRDAEEWEQDEKKGVK